METHADIIDHLGGIRPVARELGHRNHTTVQGWRDSGKIPPEKWPELIELSQRIGKPVTGADFLPVELRSAA